MESRIIKKVPGFVILVFIMTITLLLNSCSYDNEEDLYPGSVDCDTTVVTYTGTIAPIMDQYCNSCHKEGSNSIITDNYTDLKIIADDKRLWGVVNHDSNFSPMPKNADKLSSCDLKKIKKWLDEGAQNN